MENMFLESFIHLGLIYSLPNHFDFFFFFFTLICDAPAILKPFGTVWIKIRIKRKEMFYHPQIKCYEAFI